MAKIDVLLPVKNGYDFLAEAIESIINQTYQDWRLIVLDHGSTDGSFEMAKRYADNDKRVEVYQFEDAVGLSGLLNKGLELCNCDFVMRHDADDVALPNRMEVTLKAFEQHPEIDAIGGQAFKIDAHGNQTGLIRVPTDYNRLQAAFLFKNPVIHPTVTIRFKAIKDSGIRYGIDFIKLVPESERLVVNSLAEDYYIFGQLAIIGKYLNIDEYLIKYRWHGNNVSATKFMDQMNISIKISRYLARVFCIKYKQPLFDPAPFCSYGGTVLKINKAQEGTLINSFNAMKNALITAMGNSKGLSRELAFREVLTTRNIACMALKFASFALKNKRDIDEWYAIKIWLTKSFKKHKIVPLE